MENLLIPEVTLEENEDEIILPSSGDIKPFLEMSSDSKVSMGDSDDESRMGEIDVSMQIPDPLNEEESGHYNMFLKNGPLIQFQKIHCTACNIHLGTAPEGQHNRYIHPLLKVIVCKKCLEFYISGEFAQGEDGSELYCRWCGQGGVVFCCSSDKDGQCPYVFCKKCILRNVGKGELQGIQAADDWYCFICDPKQIIKHRINSVALWTYTNDAIKKYEETNNPEILKEDLSACCKRAPNFRKLTAKPVKHKLDTEVDPDFVPIDENFEPELPIKRKRHSAPAAPAPASQTPNSAVSITLKKKNSLRQDEEVVCTPDMSMLMGALAGSSKTSPSIVNQSMNTPRMLQARAAATMNLGHPRAGALPPNRMPLSTPSYPYRPIAPPQKTRPIAPPQKTRPIVPVQKKPIVLNATVNRPITTAQTQTFLQTHVTALQNNTVRLVTARGPNDHTSTPSVLKLKPGQKLEWLHKVKMSLMNMQREIQKKVHHVNVQQLKIETIDDLAGIHNDLQLFLTKLGCDSKQAATTMKTDFIAGLQQVTLINKHSSMAASKAAIERGQANKSTLSSNASGGLKIRPTSELMAKPAPTIINSQPMVIDDDDDCSVVETDPIAIEPEVCLTEPKDPIAIEPEVCITEPKDPIAIEPEVCITEPKDPIAMEPDVCLTEASDPIAIEPEVCLTEPPTLVTDPVTPVGDPLLDVAVPKACDPEVPPTENPVSEVQSQNGNDSDLRSSSTPAEDGKADASEDNFLEVPEHSLQKESDLGKDSDSEAIASNLDIPNGDSDSDSEKQSEKEPDSLAVSDDAVVSDGDVPNGASDSEELSDKEQASPASPKLTEEDTKEDDQEEPVEDIQNKASGSEEDECDTKNFQNKPSDSEEDDLETAVFQDRASDSEEEDPETKILIRRAKRESALERIMSENRKTKHCLSEQTFHHFLSVRVYMESDYGTGLPVRTDLRVIKIKDEPDLDVEEMLMGTRVSRTVEKQGASFGDAFSQFLSTSADNGAASAEGSPEEEEEEVFEEERAEVAPTSDNCVDTAESVDILPNSAAEEAANTDNVQNGVCPVRSLCLNQDSRMDLDHSELNLLMSKTKHLSDVPLDELLYDAPKSPMDVDCAIFDDNLLL